MGRTKPQGTKNLVHVIQQPRFLLTHFSNGSSHLKVLISSANYDKIVAGFEKRNYKVMESEGA